MSKIVSVINYGSSRGLLRMTNVLGSQEAWALRLTKLSALYDSPDQIFEKLKKDDCIDTTFSYRDILIEMERNHVSMD